MIFKSQEITLLNGMEKTLMVQIYSLGFIFAVISRNSGQSIVKLPI